MTYDPKSAERIEEEKRKLRPILEDIASGNPVSSQIQAPPSTTRTERRLAKKFFRKHGVK